MPSVTVPLSESLDAVLKQTAASRRRSIESVVNTALSQYLEWGDYSEPKSAIRIGNIELDPARRLVRKDSVLVHLTPTEFDLLYYLMLHTGLAMGERHDKSNRRRGDLICLTRRNHMPNELQVQPHVNK